MRLAIYLLAVVVVAHASSVTRQSTFDDSPIGFSWDNSHEQVIISRANGHISFITHPGRQESREARSLDFGTSSNSAASRGPGLQIKPKQLCLAQAFHKSVYGDVLWRIEYFADHLALIGYSLEQLLEGQINRSILHGSKSLPPHSYTDVTVSPNGIVFVVDSHGGIYQGSPANADKRNEQKHDYKLEQKTRSEEVEGTRSIVYHDRAGGLVVATHESGNLVWLDSEMNLRQSISLSPVRLPTSPKSAMDLMFLRDGRLAVLFADSLYLLQENVALSKFLVIDVLEVGSDAVLLSHALTNCSIFILSGRTTDPDSAVPYSIRELKLPAYHVSSSSLPVPRLSTTVPIQDVPRDSQKTFGLSSVRSNDRHISSGTDGLSVCSTSDPDSDVPDSVPESSSTVLRLSNIVASQARHRLSQGIVAVSSVRSNSYLISSDVDGSIVVHDAETFLELDFFVVKGTSKNGIHVTAQAVDESSNTLWRIEHWTDHFYSHVPTKHTFLVSYNLDELLEPSTPSHFQFHSCYQSLLNLVFDAFKPCHYIQPSGVYQVDMFSMHMDITCLLVIPDGSILSLSEWGSIFQIQPLDKIERVFEFKQGAFIPIKKTTLTFSPTKPNAPLRALHWPVQAITSFWTIYQSAMVYHDSGLILVPTSNCRTLERFDVNTKLWKSISVINPPSSVRYPAFPSVVFLSDGRLMVGSSSGVVLLEEVPDPTNERWMSARVVATAKPFPAKTRLCGHSICLSPYDDEIYAVSLEDKSRNLIAHSIIIFN